MEGARSRADDKSDRGGKRMKMRSFQVCQCGAPLQVNEQEAPKPQGTQVLLKMLAARRAAIPTCTSGTAITRSAAASG